MQPSNLKKGRSKTRLSEKDLAKSSNYALHTQDQDSDGDIEQKIFKVGTYFYGYPAWYSLHNLHAIRVQFKGPIGTYMHSTIIVMIRWALSMP